MNDNQYYFKNIWTGVVEDRMDPLMLNRCRVRIIGVHSENKNLVPTDALPWATVILPPTSSDTTSQLKEGDWVKGYFDYDDFDYPVILGSVPGIVLSQTNTNQSIGFVDPRTESEKKVAPNWPAGLVSQQIDKPSLPSGQDGTIENTPIERSNENKEHVCNIAEAIKLNVLLQKLKVSSIIQWVRQKIEALFSSLSQSAFAQELRAKLKQLTAKLKSLKKIIDEINEFIVEIAKLITKIREIIVWILSLPARFLAFLRECLTVFLAAISSSVTSAFTDSVSGETFLLSEITEFTQTTVSVIESASETIESSQVIIQSVQDIGEVFDSNSYGKV